MLISSIFTKTELVPVLLWVLIILIHFGRQRVVPYRSNVVDYTDFPEPKTYVHNARRFTVLYVTHKHYIHIHSNY